MLGAQPGNNRHESVVEQPDNIFEFLNLSIDSGKELHPRDFDEALAHGEITKEEHDALLFKLMKNSQEAHRDPLTGKLDRRGLKREFDGSIKKLYSTPNKAFEEKRHSSVDYILIFVVDVDSFKAFNDTFGHPAADEVLKIISDLLEDETVLRGGRVARWGGDEFVILQEGEGEITPQEVQKVAKRIEDHITSNSILNFRSNGGDEINLGVSIGGAIKTKEDNKALEALIEEADQNMYNSKRQKKKTPSSKE